MEVVVTVAAEGACSSIRSIVVLGTLIVPAFLVNAAAIVSEYLFVAKMMNRSGGGLFPEMFYRTTNNS